MAYTWTLPLPVVGTIIQYTPTVTDMRNNTDWLDDNRVCRTNNTVVNASNDATYQGANLSVNNALDCGANNPVINILNT